MANRKQKNRDKHGRFARVPAPPTAEYFPNPTGRAFQEFVQNPKPKNFLGEFAVPHHLTFAAVFQAVTANYLTLDDEAKKDNYQNALAMRRDAFVLKLLRARQMPAAELPFTIEVENPDDPEQKSVAEEITRIINAIPNFQVLKMNLLEAIWYGKAGVQLEYGHKTLGGKRWTVPTRHVPVSGDKIVWKWSGTPGILIYRPWHPDGADIEPTNWGPALFLSDPFYRDRFVIHRHEPTDTDYLFESELAGGVGGVGLRSLIYFVYQLRKQALGWVTDGLQRISTNGMLIGKFPSGNEKAEGAVMQAMKDLCERNVAVLPVDSGREQITDIDSIDPSPIAYDVLLKVVQYFDEIIETLVLGQKLSSGTESTGMGSQVADLHALTLERIIRYDAVNLGETLTSDLLQPIIKYNYGELDFAVKIKLHAESTNVRDLITAAKALYEMGVPLDAESLREKAGLVAPKGDATAIKRPEGEAKPFRFGDADKVGELKTKEETDAA